jgi:hypothetical protein
VVEFDQSHEKNDWIKIENRNLKIYDNSPNWRNFNIKNVIFKHQTFIVVRTGKFNIFSSPFSWLTRL